MENNNLNEFMDAETSNIADNETINPQDLGMASGTLASGQIGLLDGTESGLDFAFDDLSHAQIDSDTNYEDIIADFMTPTQQPHSMQTPAVPTSCQQDISFPTISTDGLALPNVDATPHSLHRGQQSIQQYEQQTTQQGAFTGESSSRIQSQVVGQDAGSGPVPQSVDTYKLSKDGMSVTFDTGLFNRIINRVKGLEESLEKLRKTNSEQSNLLQRHRRHHSRTPSVPKPGPDKTMPPPLTPYQQLEMAPPPTHFTPLHHNMVQSQHFIGTPDRFGFLPSNMVGVNHATAMANQGPVDLTIADDDDDDEDDEAPVEKKRCTDCTRNHATEEGEGERCSRCFAKYARQKAQPPVYHFDPSITTAQAIASIYPAASPDRPKIPRDNWEDALAHEQSWVRELVVSVSTPYVRGLVEGDADQCHVDQQLHFNKTALTHRQGKYSQKDVNKRMRLLFESIMKFHSGETVLYPTGGDNDGYRPDYNLICSVRLATIANVLRIDKRVCMDVIEGRGVLALAQNPSQYAKRKVQNKGSNSRKQDVLRNNKDQLRAPRANASGHEAGENIGPARRGKRRAEHSLQDNYRTQRQRTLSTATMSSSGDAVMSTPSLPQLPERQDEEQIASFYVPHDM